MRWCNAQLAKKNCAPITNICSDFQTGIKLMELINGKLQISFRSFWFFLVLFGIKFPDKYHQVREENLFPSFWYLFFSRILKQKLKCLRYIFFLPLIKLIIHFAVRISAWHFEWWTKRVWRWTCWNTPICSIVI